MPKMTVDYEDNSLMWKCPGCQLTHVVYFDRQKSPYWQWNHNVESPTIASNVASAGSSTWSGFVIKAKVLKMSIGV